MKKQTPKTTPKTIPMPKPATEKPTETPTEKPAENAPAKVSAPETEPKPIELVIANRERLNAAIALAQENLKPATASIFGQIIAGAIVGPFPPKGSK